MLFHTSYSYIHTCMQDMASWMRDGIAGLQSVVLYSLPELDGAIDTIPLGGNGGGWRGRGAAVPLRGKGEDGGARVEGAAVPRMEPSTRSCLEVRSKGVAVQSSSVDVWEVGVPLNKR